MNNQEYIDNLLKQKCDEFMKYQMQIGRQFDEILTILKEKNVARTIIECLEGTRHCMTSDDNAIWICNEYGLTLSIKLNPNIYGYADVYTTHSYENGFCSKPLTLEQLKVSVELVKKYEFLLHELKANLPKIVQAAYDWKAESDKKKINDLLSMDFGFSDYKPVKYVVNITTEEI